MIEKCGGLLTTSSTTSTDIRLLTSMNRVVVTPDSMYSNCEAACIFESVRGFDSLFMHGRLPYEIFSRLTISVYLRGHMVNLN
jgi:hypothetical protein